MKLICGKATLAVAMSVAATAAFGADLVIPDPNYASGRATAHTVKAIVEDALGLQVDMVNTTAVPVIWEAMSRGTGEIDAWTETWLPNQQGLVDRYVTSEKTVTLSDKSFPAIQGYCVTEKTYDDFGIKSVFDLANPENAAKFDTNGNGKGKIWIGPQGWQSTNIEMIRARDYGFAEFFDLQSTDEAVATAGLDAAVKAGKPWVGYCYGPHQNFALYKLKLLQEPAHDPAKFVVVTPKDDPDWMAKSKVASAYADASVHIAWSSNLAERQPEAAHLLAQIEFTNDDVNKWALDIIEGQDPDKVAKDWVNGHKDLIAKWMSK